METIRPASKSTQEAYDPQGSGMEHSKVFSRLAPGVAGSGNLKHKWGTPEDHWRLQEPPSKKGE